MATKFNFKNNNLAVVVNGEVVKQRKEAAEAVFRYNMTPGAVNGVIAKFNDIKYKDLVFIGTGIMLEVEKNAYGANNGWIIKGQAYQTAIDCSPTGLALAKSNGDLKATGCASVQLKRWDENTKRLVNDRVVVCNDRESSNGVLYKETTSVCTVNFFKVNQKLKNESRGNKKLFKEWQKSILNQVFTVGLQVDAEGNVSCVNNPSGTVYNVISWSASSERNEIATFTSMEPAKAYKVLNRVLGGALSSALERPRTVKEIKKFAKRIGNLSSAAVKTITCGNKDFGVVVYTKSVEGPEDYDAENKAKLKAAGIEIKNNTYDGSVVYSAAFIRAMFLAIGIKISLGYANLLALQSRCNKILTKVFGEGKSQKNVQYRKDVFVSMVDDSKILRAKAGEDVSHLAGKKVADYDLLIIGNENNIGMIIDADGAKALNDLSLQDVVNGGFMNYVLDIAKCSDTDTSGQMIQKFLAADKDATLKAIFSLIDGQFANRLNEYLHGDLDVKTCSLARFMLRHVKGEHAGVKNEEALRSLLNTEFMTLESQFEKYKVDLKAVFLRALFDDSYFLTKGAIDGVLSVSKYTGKLEAYSYDVELRFKDQIEAIYADDSIVDKEKATDELMTGSVFKYPSPSSDESVCMTFKTSKVLVERINSMTDLSEEVREVLIDDFVNTSFGVIKMAPNNLVKHRLAGMDTDYDGVAIVFEKAFVDIMLEASRKAGHDGLTVIKDL